MKLIDANLCVSCDEIFEGEQCPCTSKALLPLSRIIKPMQDRHEIDLTRTVKKVYEDA